MERVVAFFDPLRTPDPSQWVAFADRFPVPAAVALVVAGALALLFGEGRLFRLVAAPMGLLTGVVAGPAAGSMLGMKGHMPTYALTCALTLGGALYPPAVIFVVAGGVAGALGGALAGEADFWLGFLPGFVLGGVGAMLGLRVIEVVLSSLFGSVLVVCGASRLLGTTKVLAGTPVVALGAVGMAALAGVVFQLYVRKSAEEATRAKAQERAVAQKKREDEERMKRLASYGKKKALPRPPPNL